MSEFSLGTTPTTLPEFEQFEQTIAALLATDQLSEARTRLRQLTEAPSGGASSAGLIRLLGLILSGEVELQAGDPAAARSPLETGQRLLGEVSLPAVHAARLHHALATVETAANNAHAAQAAWLAAAEAAREHGNARLEILFRHNLALSLRDQDRTADAEAQLLKAIESAQNDFADDDPLIPTLLDALGVLYHTSGHPAASIDIFEQALDCARDARRMDPAEILRIGNNFAAALFAAERPVDAAAQLDRLLEDLDRLGPAQRVDAELARSVVDNALNAHRWTGNAKRVEELQGHHARRLAANTV